MLKVTPLEAGQTSYYDRQVAQGRDDYYSGRGEAPGQWTGAGAGRLGLSGQVGREQLSALLSGVDPGDPELRRELRDRRARPGKVAAYDLTFSAPKSVSVLYAVGDERLARELTAAHEAAVGAALEYLEDAAVRVRRGAGGRELERGGGVVAAAYRHRMSRALDPQLHTHVVAANLAEGPDGRWTGLWGTPLFRHAQTAGFLYQAHLRGEVRDRLGLEWGPVDKGMAELAGLDSEVLRRFSRRRQAIEQAAAAEGGLPLTSIARGEAMALGTRERKTYGIDTHSWRQEVQARASEYGLDRSAIAELLERGAARGGRDETVAGVDAAVLGDRLASAGGLNERANAFAERDVLRAFAAAHVQGAPVDSVRRQAGGFLGRGDVLDVAREPLGDARYTGVELVATERRLLASAVGRAGEQCAVVDDRTLERALAAGDRPLGEDQAAAVRAVARSGHGVDVIEALAGSGKTYTAGVLRQVYEDAGWAVVGVAPTGRAVRELVGEAGFNAATIDRTLMELERFEGFGPRTVVVLDEAGMASTVQTDRLLGAAQAAGAKVIAIGDPGQLPSVQAGGWMAAAGQRLGVHRLTDVRRQRDPDERRALAHLHDGRPEPYLQWAGHEQRLAVTESPGGARDTALREWSAAVEEHGIRDAVLIARDNATRAALNSGARGQRRDGGHLGDELQYGTVTVAVGDRVICRRNDQHVEVDNGTRGTVRHVDPVRVMVETDAGTVRALPADYVAEHVEHAYALTGHGMQGGTVEWAGVVAEPRDLTRGWSYTALSRARATTRLHVHGEQDERPDDPGERGPRPAFDRAAAVKRLAARMLVRDDEDLAVDQLPPVAQAGRADDQALRVTGGPIQDRAAEAATPAPAGRRELRVVTGELAQLQAQRAGLPLAALQRVERIDAELGQATGQREQLAQRLGALPTPGKSFMGRAKDDHAGERARLTAAVGAADQQLDALTRHRSVAVREVGPNLQEIRGERDGLDSQIEKLQRVRRGVRDDVADRELADRPRWLQDTLGAPPSGDAGRREWDQAARSLARYRVDEDLADDVPGVGPEPHDPDKRRDWQRVSADLARAQRRLGREQTLARDRGRGRGRGLD